MANILKNMKILKKSDIFCRKVLGKIFWLIWKIKYAKILRCWTKNKTKNKQTTKHNKQTNKQNKTTTTTTKLIEMLLPNLFSKKEKPPKLDNISCLRPWNETELPFFLPLTWFSGIWNARKVYCHPLLLKGLLHLLPKISMFCALSQNDQQLFEK